MFVEILNKEINQFCQMGAFEILERLNDYRKKRAIQKVTEFPFVTLAFEGLIEAGFLVDVVNTGREARVTLAVSGTNTRDADGLASLSITRIQSLKVRNFAVFAAAFREPNSNVNGQASGAPTKLAVIRAADAVGVEVSEKIGSSFRITLTINSAVTETALLLGAAEVVAALRKVLVKLCSDALGVSALKNIDEILIQATTTGYLAVAKESRRIVLAANCLDYDVDTLESSILTELEKNL